MKPKDSRYYRLIQSTRWRQLRQSMLTEHPLCELCLERGLYVSATEVHHKEPCETATSDADMERLMFTPSNLQCLCHQCHQDEHRRLRSRSRDEIRRRNDARAARFAEKFLDTPTGGYVFNSPLPRCTNPLPQIRDKFSGNGITVGGGETQDHNEKD